jgi:hypothetical protein
MWIFDSYYKGCVELWSHEGRLSRTSAAYSLSFYMHLKDPHSYWDMIERPEKPVRVEECSFNTIFGTFQGRRIFASRKVAEKIEIQTRSTSAIWPRKTSSPAETETSPGSLPILRSH